MNESTARRIVAGARLWTAAPCLVCGHKGVTQFPESFMHDWCRGKPKPCELCETGAPSMPYPLCAHCKGSGRIEKELCPFCPPGPCVSCCWNALLSRIRADRGSG